MAAALEGVLSKLLVPNNDVIKQATLELREAFKDPNIIIYLCHVICGSQQVQIRQLGAVLLRRRVLLLKRWNKTSPDIKKSIKECVIQALQQEREKIVRSALSQLAGTVAKHELASAGWPELMQLVHQMVKSEDPQQKEAGLMVLSMVTAAATQQLKPQLPALLNLMANTIHYQQNIMVPYYTIKTLTSLVPAVGSSEKPRFQRLIPQFKGVILQLLSADEELAGDVLEIFDELMACEVDILAPYVENTIEFLLELSVRTDLEDGTRVKCLGLVALMARLKKKAILKSKLIAPIIKVLFRLMCTVPVESADFFEDVETNTPAAYAAQVVDTIALNFPPEKVFPVVIPFVEAALKSSLPQERAGAYLALAVIAEGCGDHMRTKHLATHLQWIGEGAVNESPIVRGAALFALGQFSEHIQPDVSKFAQHLLPLLLRLLTEMCQGVQRGSPDPPGVSKMFYALEKFCENLGEGLLPYLGTLMETMFAILATSSSSGIRELALSFIGAAAYAVANGMVPYFEMILCELRVHLVQPTTKENAPLQLQSLDTLAVLARALGDAHFQPMALQCLHLGLNVIQNVDDPDLRRCAYSLIAALSTVLKSQMEPYLPDIINRMMDSVQSTEGIVARFAEDGSDAFPIFDELSGWEDEEDLTVDDGEDDEDGEEAYGVENSYLDEKADACSALQEIVANVGVAFLPFFDNCWSEMVNLIDYPASTIRKAAAEALGQLCISLGQAKSTLGNAHGHNLDADKCLGILVPKLVELATEDGDRSVALAALETINELLKNTSSPSTVFQEHLEDLVATIRNVMQGKVTCQDPAACDGDDECEDDEEAEQDALLVEYAGELVPNLARVIPPQTFVPYFAGLLHLFVGRTHRTKPVSTRSFAVGILAESVTPLGPAGIKPFVKHLFNVFHGCATDHDEEVRSNAIFGLGVLVESGQQEMQPYCHSVMQILENGCVKETDNRALDNICGALSRAILTWPDDALIKRALPSLVGKLPLREDFEENVIVFRCICKLVESKPDKVLDHLPDILKVVTSVLGTSQIKPETESDLVQLVLIVKRNFPAPFEALISTWEPHLVEKLQLLHATNS